MKTKMTTSRIVDTGASRLPRASNGITPAVLLEKARVPSSLWKNVKSDEIGAGFEIEEFEELPVKRKKLVRTPVSKRERVFTNKFIHLYGDGSRFVWFYVEPPKPKAQKPKAKKQPTNFKNILDKKTRLRFAGSLDKSILATSNFMMKELLPRTLSLHTATERASELLQQLVDQKVALPLSFMEQKHVMAMHLRIVRFISEQFELTDEERKLMVLEYTRPWTHQ